MTLKPLNTSSLKIRTTQVLLEFTSNSQSLYALSVNGVLSVIDLQSLTCTQAVITNPDTLQPIYPRLATVSPGFEWLVIVALDHSVWVYELATSKVYWKVPVLACPTCVKCFDFNRLFIVTDDNRILMYDIAHKAVDGWTRDQGSKLPKNYLDRYNRVYDVLQLSEHTFILYTHYTFMYLDTERPVPKSSHCVTNKAYVYNTLEEDLHDAWAKLVGSHQRAVTKSCLYPRRPEPIPVPIPISDAAEVPEKEDKHDEFSHNLAIYNKYSVILKMGYNAGDKRLYVVESPWNKMLKSFPGVLQSHKYGH